MSKVSVIIPCYKQAHFLREAVDSVLAQTHGGAEVIVVNDGSPDNTREVALSYGDRIRYVERPNGGLPAARNTGLGAVTGDYVQFLDADDFLLPEMHARLLAVLEADRSVAAAYCGYYRSDITGRPQQTIPARVASDDMFHSLLASFPWPCHAIILRRSALPAAPVFDVGLHSCEDSDVWLRMARAGATFRRVDYTGAVYRISGSSMSSNGARMFRTGVGVLRRHARAHGCPRCDTARAEGERMLWQHFGLGGLQNLLASERGKDWLTACIACAWLSPKLFLGYAKELRFRKRTIVRALLPRRRRTT